MISTSPSTLETVRLNNEATYHMRSGDYVQASSCLSSALLTLREAIQSDRFQDITMIDARCERRSEKKKRSFYFVSRYRGGMAFETTSDMECDDWFLHEDAIMINLEQAFTSIRSIEILSYSIIYNLALCHHIKAMRDLSTRSETLDVPSLKDSEYTPDEYLRRATTLYIQAEKLLVSHDLNNLGGNDDMLYKMAITNNLGHAYHFLHKESTAKAYFQRLLLSLVSISEHREREGIVESCHGLCFDGFLTNAMNLMCASSAAPAA